MLLVERGAVIPCPAAVEVDETVRPERIAPGVVIHAGCRLAGETTSIGPFCEIGGEGPAVVENCQLGRKVRLRGGYFSESCFLDGAGMGSGAHVRSGTLLEEEASGAHAVGLKQTVFLPYVTAGSLINFCDCLLSGGTSRKNHSEIGSSYVHFNFTPHQDKATPSLIGDVPRGVMLDQAPVFLGGQGGLVGPVRIEYGTVIPAGIICRQDLLEGNQIAAIAPPAASAARRFSPGRYLGVNRIVHNNLLYIGNIQALMAWYKNVRKRTMQADRFGLACWEGALARLESILEERIRRLAELAGRMPASVRKAQEQSAEPLPEIPYAQQRVLGERWSEIERALRAGPGAEPAAPQKEAFLAAWARTDSGVPYPEAIARIDPESRQSGTRWLQAIVDFAASLWVRAQAGPLHETSQGSTIY